MNINGKKKGNGNHMTNLYTKTFEKKLTDREERDSEDGSRRSSRGHKERRSI